MAKNEVQTPMTKKIDLWIKVVVAFTSRCQIIFLDTFFSSEASITNKNES